jgi:predicted ATPase
VEEFEDYGSTALFKQSARRVQAEFEVRGDERQWVAQICQMLLWSDLDNPFFTEE